MNARERFVAPLERRPVDPSAIWFGLPVPDDVPDLLRCFAVDCTLEKYHWNCKAFKQTDGVHGDA